MQLNTETLVLAGLIVLVLLIVSRPHRRRWNRKNGHSWFYEAYMHSHLWRLRRWLWYWTSNRRCENPSCHRKMVLHQRGLRYKLGTPVATFHHKNYAHLGHERRGRDIEMLCWSCHSSKDAWRHR